MICIGIDPGKSGGLAFLYDAGPAVYPMPATEIDLWRLLGGLSEPARAMLERVSSSPQMGVVSAFTFGAGYGRLRMALAAAGIPFDEVSPARWQAAMGCRSGGDKNVTKRRAQELFPAERVTHAVADALLLAEYCRRLHTGVLARG